MGAQDAARGAQFKVRLGDINFITLDVHGTVLERLDAASAQGAGADAEGTDDAEDVAGSLPLAIAMDVDDAASAASSTVPAPTAPLSP
jgi:exoribonuclease-2